MEKHNEPIQKLGEVLDKSLKRLDPSGRLGEYGVWPIWNETVGDTVARNAQPEKIRQGTLFVKVSSPVWMQQLQYMKDTIAEKLNQELGKEIVKNIFFVVGNVEAKISEKKGETRQSPALSEPQSKLAEETLTSVGDPDIRRALKRLFAAHSRKRKS
jgi:predicted nucleic acid-binding Zn ribbon protein